MVDQNRILLITKYQNGIIKYSEFNRSIHRGNIYYPLCNSPIRVAYNLNGFFIAYLKLL